MKVQRGGGKKSSGRYHMQYEEEYYYEDDAEGEDESDTRHRWPARSADGKFRVSSHHMSLPDFPDHKPICRSLVASKRGRGDAGTQVQCKLPMHLA